MSITIFGTEISGDDVQERLEWAVSGGFVGARGGLPGALIGAGVGILAPDVFEFFNDPASTPQQYPQKLKSWSEQAAVIASSQEGMTDEEIQAVKTALIQFVGAYSLGLVDFRPDFLGPVQKSLQAFGSSAGPAVSRWWENLMTFAPEDPAGPTAIAPTWGRDKPPAPQPPAPPPSLSSGYSPWVLTLSVIVLIAWLYRKNQKKR